MTTKKYKPTIYGGSMQQVFGTKIKAVINCHGIYDGYIIEGQFSNWQEVLIEFYKRLDKKRKVKTIKVPTKTKLTNTFKHGVAENIIAAIKEGNNTFGKLRKSLQHTDRELKSGLRYGLANWIYKTKISKDKKTYSLIKL